MKKIFTLFMATVIVAAMFALPKTSSLVGKKIVPASFEQQTEENPLVKKASVLRKENVFKREYTRHTETASNATTRKQAVAEGQTINWTMDIMVGPEYYEETGDWYISLGNDEGWSVKLDWYAPEGENKDGYVGTFAMSDFEVEYSYMVDPYYEYVEFEDITLVISKESKGDYAEQLNLNATILGDDGNTYVITASKELYIPKDTIEVVIEDATLAWDADEMISVLKAKNDLIDLSFTYGATWATGPFSMLDIYLDESSVKYKGVELDLQTVDMLVSAIKNENGQVGYQVALSMISSEPIQYDLSLFAPLYATDTVEIEFNNLEIDESGAADWGWIFCNATTTEWTLNAGIAAWQMEEGTYLGEEYVMFYLTNEEIGDFTEQVYAEAVVTNDPQYGWVLDIESHCTDNKLYKVSMKKSIPTPVDTVVMRFENSANAAYYPWFDNDLLLANSNDMYYAGLDVYGVELGSNFTLENMDMEYSLIFSDYPNRVMVQMADVQGTIYQEGDTTIIKAYIIGYDSVLYDVELWHCVPTPVDTVKLDIKAEFVNKIESDGYYQLAGYNSENTLYVSLAPVVEDEESLVGTFVNDGVFSRFGSEGGLYDFYCDYTAIYKNVDGQAVPYPIEKCSMTVTLSDEGVITAVASFIATDSVQYEVTMTSEYNKHLDYDAKTGAIDRSYSAEDDVLLEEQLNGAVYFEVIAADGSDLFALYLFPEVIDEDITIQPGTYSIDDTQDYFTVLASVGVYDNYVQPSFYGKQNEQGYLVTPLYFFVGGTVDVSKNEAGKLHIEVNAVNSYDVPIHVVYDDNTATAVDNIATKTTGVEKKLINGQLMIIRNGEVYTATGAKRQ